MTDEMLVFLVVVVVVSERERERERVRKRESHFLSCDLEIEFASQMRSWRS